MSTILMQHPRHGRMHVYSLPECETAEARGWAVVVAEPEPLPAIEPEPEPVAVVEAAPIQQVQKRPYNRRK